MKPLLIKLSFVFLLLTIVTSCSTENEDDTIFFKEINETKITYSPIEKEILILINEYRNEKGLTSLSILNLISTVAETHTSYMVKIGEVNHDNFPERHQTLVNNAQAISVGENVAYGYSSAESVVNAWIKSDHHREVIEDSEFTHFGISTQNDEKGMNYFTQIFINK